MNYKLHYEKLISKARNRSILKSEYKETHHIIPKSIGGTDDESNLVSLFAREHMIAHLLLIKIYPNNSKLLHACFRMSNFKRTSSKEYEWLKKKWSDEMKRNNPMHNPEVRQKVGEKIKGNTPWNKGLDKNDERVQKGIYERTEECREKSRQTRLGTKMKDSTKQILREQRVGKSNLKNGKEVLLISPKGDEILVKHKIAQKCNELGISYKALNKFRNEVVPKSTRKNSFLREATEGWSLKDLELS